MGKPGFAKARGMKRPNSWKEASKKSRKIANRKDKKDKVRPPQSDSEDWSEGNSDVASEDYQVGTKEEEEEIVLTKEPTMYDNLLKKLGSKSEAVAQALKRRKRDEEGRSDTEDDNDAEDDSDAEDDGSDFELRKEEEKGEDSPRKNRVQSGSEGSTSLDSDKNSEDSVSDDEDINESDIEEDDLRKIGESTAEASTSASSFISHLEYNLSKAEVEKLAKKKWNFIWEVPAFGAPNCKWRGTGKCVLEGIDEISGYDLKPRLYKHLLDVYKGSGVSDFHTSKQRYFFSMCNSYYDILHHNKKPFYLKGLQEDSSIMDGYLTHALNHILRSRDLVTKHNAKLVNSDGKADILTGDAFRDQGFTRPKVLILLPLASIAFRVVKRLIQLTPPKHKVKVEHFDRFTENFGNGGEEDGDDKEDIEKLKEKKSSKPSDFEALFGGNNDDFFMMGIKYMGSKMKLYGDFYSSDIIVASPLGLITKIGDAELEKEKDVDYLSSIEVMIIDHADVILMQNWTHVNTIFEQLNQLPSKQHGTDIMRIRPWYLDGQAQYYRQTIVLSSHLNPDINSAFNRYCLNYRGKIKLVCSSKGVLPKVLLQVRQIYERFDAPTIAEADDARFEYFCKKVFPKIKDSVQGGIMLFISSYFEFVRLRNFLKSQEASFCLLGEYTKQSDISRARVWFFQGKRKIMLYTERAHFYHRYKIRGTQNLFVYSLPERKEFYPEIVNMLEGSQNMSCTVLFSRFDLLRLERIVGSSAAKRMTTSEKGLFVFC
ncbi:OLC1v1022682C1 [Oldenlandia corymbosa var. corymbosa]|uniref:OLC1v1022682C1 n=1 Tax=Oldenlandia corymbosa var. corymbosa TaxID=529605 RepID=A0AAV1BZY7_OLDCO|nr:OLC1v1022682C1 [Oldenlandia corymbosa var. corymbosa]